MIRHISVFFFKKDTSEESKEMVENLMEELGNKLNGVRSYAVGKNCANMPPKGMPGVPEFGDFVQVIDFDDSEMANSYAFNSEHLEVVKRTSEFFEKVVAIDFEL